MSAGITGLTEFVFLPSSTIKGGRVHVLDHNDPGRHLKLIRAAMSRFPTCLIGISEDIP